ncbi:MAG: T9SS type A sorting domain-containing protein [Chlorobi bacterium]|nr:T9SS type A sorting domain-containing protein [Chlorobiota bacterium]
MKKLLLTGIILVSFVAQVYAQDVPGCTDPRANNYNPAATVNDGSCTYDPTFYSPPFRFLLPAEVKETSGLLYYDNDFWTLNDSGNDPIIYRLDTTNGSIIQRITVLKASNVDWETLAQDDDYIYIGDVGNNSGNRDDLGIYIVAKASIPASGDASVNSNHITFTYSDYPGQKIERDDNNFDCEAMICIGDSLYLFSKNWGNQKTKLYRFPKTPGNYTAEKIYTYDANGLVTGADYNKTAKEITLLGYHKSTKIPFFWLLFDYHDNLLFSGNKRRIDLISIVSNQSEGITYTNDKNGIISSEGTLLNIQSANNFSTGQWTDSITTGIHYLQGEAFNFTLSPNPVSHSKLTVTVPRLPKGNYEVKVYDSAGKLMQIKNYSLGSSKGGLKIKLKVGDLKPGIYFVRIRSGSQALEKKFIKQ